MLGELLEALLEHKHSRRLTKLGKEMFRFKSELGFPPDMFLSKLEETYGLLKSEKIYVLHTYCEEVLEHKRASAAQEKALERTRKQNKAVLSRFIGTGEVGIY
jgi:hypothetical protein